MAEFSIAQIRAAHALREGIVIPAHPLALTPARKLDERRQRALTRYYHAAGAGGIAVGVHTTQFAIREHGLLKTVLELAATTAADCDSRWSEGLGISPDRVSPSRSAFDGKTAPEAQEQTKEVARAAAQGAAVRETVLIAGICGQTRQAVAEAQLAAELGYHAGLLSLAALREADDDELIVHCKAVASIIPPFGFYLQPAVGGRPLSLGFWRRFVEIPNVVAIKIAAFNRYQTLDVIRALAESHRGDEIALYTGNDDNIVVDLLTEFAIPTDRGEARLRIVGGLLGHWACWTRKAVDLLAECKRSRGSKTIPASLLTLAAQVTDCNAAIFDAAHNFAGCVPGIHEILRRQRLLEGTWCLNAKEKLSPNQSAEIDRICAAYPHLNDDTFVREHLDEWLRG